MEGVENTKYQYSEQSGLFPRMDLNSDFTELVHAFNVVLFILNDFEFGQDVPCVAILSKFKIVR